MLLRATLALALLPVPALAHAGAQSFVLLLPTGLYIAGGLAAVVLTVALVTILPASSVRRLFAPRRFYTLPFQSQPFHTQPAEASSGMPGSGAASRLALAVSFLALAIFVALLFVGFNGSNDPTRNPLPVAIWTVLWLQLSLVAGIIGSPWRWITPWAFPLTIARQFGARPVLPLPPRLGHWPALLSLAAIASLLLIHPKAADPDTLAILAAAYFSVHLIGALLFGPDWLNRAEALTVTFAAFGSLAALTTRAVGVPGWQALARPVPDAGLALFMVSLLAIGSFDGLYKTFFWLDLIGVNPLEFAGRTTVIGSNSFGLALSVFVLSTVYAACLAAGLALIGAIRQTPHAFCAFAPTLLPIALAYHFAHFLPAILVEIQLIPVVLNDPLGTGAQLLGLIDPRVTTGFLNRLDTVRVIWLCQAGAVVAGHMLAILMAHRVALKGAGGHRRAAVSQIPLAAFMIGYTLFGLWLLASPQGA